MAGQQKQIYLHDDVLRLLRGTIEGVEPFKGSFSELVNELIRRHFSNDEAVLEKKMDELTRERDMLQAKLTGIRETKMREQTRLLQKKEQTEDTIKKKAFLAKLKQDWQDGKINDDEYWSNFK